MALAQLFASPVSMAGVNHKSWLSSSSELYKGHETFLSLFKFVVVGKDINSQYI